MNYSKFTSKFHSESVPHLSNTLKGKNNLIQREFDLLKTTLNRQVDIEMQKDIRIKSSLEQNLKKLQSFRQTQFETEYEQQVENLKKKLEKENLQKNFKKLNKNNRLIINTLPDKFEININKNFYYSRSRPNHSPAKKKCVGSFDSLSR